MQTRDYVMEVNLLVPLKGAKGKENTSLEVVMGKRFSGFPISAAPKGSPWISLRRNWKPTREFYLTSVTIELSSTKGRRAPHSFTTVHRITKGVCMCVFICACTHTRASVKAALCCAGQQSS